MNKEEVCHRAATVWLQPTARYRRVVEVDSVHCATQAFKFNEPFSMCPTERVLDTAKSPDPGAACPDRAQRAGWERQSQSVVTDGSHTCTNVCRLNLHRTRDRGQTSICCSTVRLKAQYFT